MRTWLTGRFGRMRVSTIVLIVAFLALFWVYHNFEPRTASTQAPTTAVVPPGFVPDPNYTWVPRTSVRRPEEPLSTTETTTTTSPTETTTTTTSPGETTSPTTSPTLSTGTTPTTTVIPGPLGPQTVTQTPTLTPTSPPPPGSGPA